MTVSELYNQVAGLGFETSLEDDSRFVYAANRSLLQINSIRPATRTYTIYHSPLGNVASICSFDPIERREDLCFEANDARSFFFECNGNGIAYIDAWQDGAWNPIDYVELSAPMRAFKQYRGFIKFENNFVNGRVRIRFVGIHLYAVKCVALYLDVYSDDVEDIPAYEPFTRYDISKLTDDFLALDSPPIQEAENSVLLGNHYGIEDDRIILLPHDMHGSFNVHYKHLPQRISIDQYEAPNSPQIIDLDDDLSALMPNLVAAYIWAEDEPQLAEYYLTLYQQQAAAIEAKSRSYTPIHIYNNGW